MKNTFKKYFILFALVFSLLFVFAACARETLATPNEVELSVEEILTWDKVEGADRYIVKINEKEHETTNTYMDLFNKMTTPGVFSINVMALDDNGDYLLSEWSQTIEHEVFTLTGANFQPYEEDYHSIAAVDKSTLKGKIVIPSTYQNKDILAIGASVFANCTKITGIMLPSTIEDIGRSCFSGCTALKRIALSSATQKLPNGLFNGCTSLEKVDIPDGVNSIDNIFIGCTSLKEVFIPQNVEEITNLSFANCINLEKIEVSKLNRTFKSDGKCLIKIADNTVVVGCASSTIPDYVQNIGNRAFSEVDIESLDFPDGLKTIGELAFSNCRRLKEVVLPEGLTTIGNMAFAQCTSLEKLILPASLTSLGAMAFLNCTGLKTVVLPVVAAQTSNLFVSCDKLEEVTFLEGTTTIAFGLFSTCPALTKVVLPASLTDMTNPFPGAKSFDFVKISEDNQTFVIEGNCIIDLPNKTVVAGSSLSVIPDYVTAIGPSAFYYVELENLVLPVGVKSIGDEAFKGANIKTISLPNGLQSIGKEAFTVYQPISLVMPDSVTVVGEKAFYGAKVTLYMSFIKEEVPAGWASNSRKDIFLNVYDADIATDGVYPYIKSIYYSTQQINIIGTGSTVIDPTRIGYTFLGWTTEQNSTTPKYSPI